MKKKGLMEFFFNTVFLFIINILQNKYFNDTYNHFEHAIITHDVFLDIINKF